MQPETEQNILLVEDEVIIAMAESKMLERHGYRVKTVLNGEDAVKEGVGHGFDLILMDIDLGRSRMDGTEAAKAILENRDVPIIFLTSHSEKVFMNSAEIISRYGYILKSDGESVIIQSIRQALESPGKDRLN